MLTSTSRFIDVSTAVVPIRRYLLIGMAAATLCILVLCLATFSSSTEMDENRTLKLKQSSLARDNQTALRFMTFNIWVSGRWVEDGLKKIAKHIKAVDPDIVTVQELSSAETMDQLLDELGEPWTGAFRGGEEYADDGILTKHTILINDSIAVHAGVGVSIKLTSGQRVRAVGLHLAYRSYGPYAANNKLVVNESQIYAGEAAPAKNNRVDHVKNLLANERFQDWLFESDRVPLFVAGDLNTPSHLDWTEATKAQHGGWVYAWPATKLLTDAGLVDAYRHKYPDPLKYPGNTWSTVQKSESVEWNYTIPEPQDRLDMIFFKHPNVDVVDAQRYKGSEPLKPIPYHRNNSYPSDHYAVFVDFAFR